MEKCDRTNKYQITIEGLCDPGALRKFRRSETAAVNIQIIQNPETEDGDEEQEQSGCTIEARTPVEDEGDADDYFDGRKADGDNGKEGLGDQIKVGNSSGEGLRVHQL